MVYCYSNGKISFMEIVLEKSSTIDIIDDSGEPIHVNALLECFISEYEWDGAIVSSDDRIIEIVGAMKADAYSGRGPGTMYEFYPIRSLPKGTFEFISQIPISIKAEKERRIAAKLPFKQWHNRVQGAVNYIIDDDAEILQAMKMGIMPYLLEF